jgi:hypothetical protein
VVTDVVPGQPVQEHLAAANLPLLLRCQDRDDKTIADVDVELIPGPPPGPMGVKPRL